MANPYIPGVEKSVSTIYEGAANNVVRFFEMALYVKLRECLYVYILAFDHVFI